MIIVTILDESGSMGVIKQSTISGFNEFMSERKVDIRDNSKTISKFVKIIFNSTVRVEEYDNIDDVVLLDEDNYCPNGMTALYDAIGCGFDVIDDYCGEEVWFIIITDGLENHSVKYKKTQIQKSMSLYKKCDNWNFIFCGANQDSYLTSCELGMDDDDTVIDFTQNADSVGSLYRHISRQVSGNILKNEIYEASPKFSDKRPTLVRTTTDTSI